MKTLSLIAAMVLLLAPVTFAKSIDASEVPDKKAQTHIIAGQTELAFDLYQTMIKTETNLFFSPYSVSVAMSMVYVGAGGATEKQMAKVLHLPDGREKTHAAIKQISQNLTTQARHSNTTLKIANGLCETGAVSPAYKQLLRDAFDAEVFAGGLDEINTWASRKTEGRIPKILDKLSPNSECVILNAVYFKADWLDQFSKEFTRQTPFHISETGDISVPMMQKQGDFAFVRVGDSARAISMPYASNVFSMVVILPDAQDGLTDVEKALDGKKMTAVLSQLDKASTSQVDLRLPKWKMETEYDLIPTFGALGLGIIFGDDADFSGVGSVAGDLQVEQIVHKAFLEVDEKGSEAAAVTAIEMTSDAIAEPPPVFQVDHPFMFLIRHNDSGAILFMGRVINPAK